MRVLAKMPLEDTCLSYERIRIFVKGDILKDIYHITWKMWQLITTNNYLPCYIRRPLHEEKETINQAHQREYEILQGNVPS